MKIKLRFLLCSLVGAIAIAPIALSAGETVTVDNFVRAETDMTMNRYVDQGAFGKFFHIRQPTPIDKQDVIRMNRDTLYSVGIFDLTTPVTVVKPDSGDRFMSMMIVNQDHSIPQAEYGAGEFTLTKEELGTRYVFVAFRTFVNANDPADVKLANGLQDKIAAKQANAGTFKIPDWDAESLETVRDAINVLSMTKTDTSGYFGVKGKIDPIYHLLGTAYGWGGNPKEDAFYVGGVPAKNDGKTAYSLTVKDVPLKDGGFWSLTVYNAKGFMEKNEQDSYSFNNVTAKPDADDSITLNFGGDSSQANYMPITDGWNYLVRLYKPGKEILDASWTFPSAVEAK